MSRWRSGATGVAVVLAAVALYLSPPLPLVKAELSVQDLLAGMAGPGLVDGQVVVVEIDEESLGRVGRWPWPRERLAALVKALMEAGAATIALDMMFPEPDIGRGDEALARVMAGAPVLVGYYFSFTDGRGPPGDAHRCHLHPAPVSIIGHEAAATPRFPRASGVICSLPALAQAARGSGFLNAGPDADGQIRRAALLLRHGEHVYPSLALAAVLIHRRLASVRLTATTARDALLFVGPGAVCLESSSLLVRFRGPARTLPHISAADVLDGNAGGKLEGKMVFVGGSAAGLQDVISTPADPLMPGVEFQATVAGNLILGDAFSRPPGWRLAELGALLAVGFVPLGLLLTFRLRLAVPAVLGVIALSWAASTALACTQGVIVSPLPATLAGGGVLGILGPLRLFEQRRRAEELARKQTAAKHFALSAVASLVEARAASPEFRPGRIQPLTRILCEAASGHPGFRQFLSPEVIEILVELAPIHDIGKVYLPDRILRKGDPLTPGEWEQMRSHVEYGRDLLKQIWRRCGGSDETLIRLAMDLVFSHHERWDGTGYPAGLRGDEIPLPARLIAIVDVYDSLTGGGLPHDTAVQIVAAGRGGQFDPDLVDSFLSVRQRLRGSTEPGEPFLARSASAP
jgi:CHASE2 domain-containing sensor protein